MLRINIKEFLILMIMSAIMLTTAFMPFGLPATSGSFLIGISWLFLCTIFFFSNSFGPMVQGYKFFLFIILLSTFTGYFKAVFVSDGDLKLFFNNFFFKALPKVLFLFFIYFLISKLDHSSVNKVSYKYATFFIFTIALSLIIYQFFPLYRFVWYENRFASFHFELVNFSFTAFISGLVLLFFYIKNLKLVVIGISILSFVIYIVSLSNYVPIFLGSLLFSFFLLKSPKWSRKIIFSTYFFSLIIILLMLPNLLHYIEEVLFLFPRTSGSLNDDNPIFIRLYRHIFAIEYFFNNFYMPSGFFNGGFDADLSLLVIPSWNGGSGLSKLFMDFGFLIVPFLILLLITFFKILDSIDTSNHMDYLYFIIVNLCFAYGYLQAGFFNFTSVSFFLLSLRYWRII